MIYKKLDIWTAGDEKGKKSKIELFMFIIALLLFIMIDIIFFTSDKLFDDTANNPILCHLFSGVFILIATGWLQFFIFYMCKDTIEIIRTNKKIPLYFYDITEFMRLNNLPDGQYVVFLDQNGAILAEKEFTKESDRFICTKKSFYEIKEYCENLQ